MNTNEIILEIGKCDLLSVDNSFLFAKKCSNLLRTNQNERISIIINLLNRWLDPLN
jgi:hypothetical protein